MKTLKVAAALVPLVLLAACGGTDVKPASGESANVADQSPGATASPSTTGDPNLPSEDTLNKYFDGLGTDTLDSLQESIDAAQPGSPAFAYATYLRGFDQAAIDGGAPDDEVADTTKIDGGFKLCQGSGSDETCYEYKDIEGADGKVSNFTVNSKPIANRLTIGNGKAVMATGSSSSATFIAAFVSSTGNSLYIVVSIKAGSKGVGLVQAKYLSPEGRHSESSDDTGPSDLDPGALANFGFAFPSAKIGGTLKLTISDSNYDDSTITLKTQ
jgi:hypothetical protein